MMTDAAHNLKRGCQTHVQTAMCRPHPSDLRDSAASTRLNHVTRTHPNFALVSSLMQ